MQGQLLDPTDVSMAYNSDGGRREVVIDVSDIALHVSPDAITVVSEVSDTVLTPLQAARPTQPLRAVNVYKRIVSCHCKRPTVPPYAAVGSGGLYAMSEERGFTFWAPVVPPGHGILGHVLTAGASQPTHEVVCAALASGIVSWPEGFEHRWNAGAANVWDAIPPPGYAAMGCVVTTDGNAPSLQSMVCIHMQALVTAPLGECLARSGEGSLWAVDNAAGSFMFSDEESAYLVWCFT
jgi:vacuolar protein sorting-associated protein 13A/C